MQPGDIYQTNADTTKLEAERGYKPHWSLHDGIAEFMKWYKSDKNPLRQGEFQPKKNAKDGANAPLFALFLLKSPF